MKKMNLFAIAAVILGVLLIDAAVNSRSPVDVLKSIVSGTKLPDKGSGKK